mgnify:CR=1 FL=1
MKEQQAGGKYIEVNGTRRAVAPGQEERKLIDFIREDLGLTGTKNGCGIGVCGACTVLVNGKPKRSCITKLQQVTGKSVLTIEGLEGSDGSLHPLQQAFIDAGAVQCGFCTPGMILTSYALLAENADPDREEIRHALRGNLCRCTGYQQIISAVELAAERMRRQNL